MTPIRLLESFYTGHPKIDAQHQELVEIINAVHAAVEDGELPECQRLLDSFMDVARHHFATEEGILEDLGYPDLEEHAAYHGQLITKAERVQAMCRDAAVSRELGECFDEMATFFVDDILRGDVSFLSYLQQAGFSRPE